MVKELITLARKPLFDESKWRGMGSVLLFSFIINLLMLTIPIYSLQVFDRVLVSRSQDTLLLLTLGVILAIIIIVVFESIRSFVLIRIANHIDATLSPKVFNATVTMAYDVGNSNAQSLRDIIQIRNFIAGSQGLIALLDAPWIPIFIVIVWMIHPWLGIAMIVGMILLALLTFITQWSVGGLFASASDHAFKAQKRAEETIRNADIIEAMGMRRAVFSVWYTLLCEANLLLSRASDRAALFQSTGKLIRLSQNIVITGVGAYLAIHNEITMGGMIAANILVSRGLAPMEGLIGSWKNYTLTSEAILRLDELIKRYSTKDNATLLPPMKGDLSLDEVSYTPEGSEKSILKNISLTLGHGTVLGIIGPSAAGKSTLAKLIAGLWKPTSGSIRIDGADVYTTWNRSQLGGHVGYLPQTAMLMSGSIKENIARFHSCEDKEVVLAAEAAGAHTMILSLPNGYDTHIESDASILSGGQRQRIALARALFREPQIIILDEPETALDQEGIERLVGAIRHAKQRGASVIVITHRPSMITDADKLAVVAQGELKDFGEYNTLMRQYGPQSQKIMQRSPRGAPNA